MASRYAARIHIEAGFPQGDDAFDAVVGLFGMLEVLLRFINTRAAQSAGVFGAAEPSQLPSLLLWT